MIPYDEYELSAQQLNDLKAKNQRHAVYQYIKENGVEPDYETTQSFYSASTEQIEHEKMVQYSNIYEPTPPPTPHDYSQDYLTFVFSTNGNIVYYSEHVSYSVDNGATWNKFDGDVSVSSGDKILLKGIGCYGGSRKPYAANGKYSIEGNIMSIIYGDNFIGQTALYETGAFSNLFAEDTNLTSAQNLILPATTLSENCYDGMFQSCTGLTTAPELPATTLAEGCYNWMFNGCTSLTTAPELPATTLANYCYSQMFDGCTNLNYIKCLATDISADSCTYDWVNAVSASGTFVKAASMSDWTTGANGIPSGWTVQNAN